MQQSFEEVVNEIFELYQKYGGEDYIGEPVSQLQHMCQCAELAEAAGNSEEIIIAAFMHDLGHFCEHLQPVQQMDGYGVVDHEKLGADYLLEQGFSPAIASLVRNHVQAKRYLTWRYPEYYEKLIDACKSSFGQPTRDNSSNEKLKSDSSASTNYYKDNYIWKANKLRLEYFYLYPKITSGAYGTRTLYLTYILNDYGQRAQRVQKGNNPAKNF